MQSLPPSGLRAEPDDFQGGARSAGVQPVRRKGVADPPPAVT
jgi:hypothetical protein